VISSTNEKRTLFCFFLLLLASFICENSEIMSPGTEAILYSISVSSVELSYENSNTSANSLINIVFKFYNIDSDKGSFGEGRGTYSGGI